LAAVSHLKSGDPQQQWLVAEKGIAEECALVLRVRKNWVGERSCDSGTPLLTTRAGYCSACSTTRMRSSRRQAVAAAGRWHSCQNSSPSPRSIDGLQH